jgi:hypothetical protein
MRRALALAVACALLLVSFSAAAEAQAKEKARPCTPAAVLAAVERLLSRPVPGAVRPEFSIVFDFADTSEDGSVTIGPPFFDFTGNDALDHPLLVYYAAGAVKFDRLEKQGALDRYLAEVPTDAE